MTILIIIVLGGLGLVLVLLGFCWFVVAIRRHPHLKRISGTVVSVEEKYDYGGDEKRISFFPIIRYTTPEGQQVRFRSSTGTSRRVLKLAGPTVSPWREGQSIDVFHDPGGTLGPCIASLWSLYGWTVGLLAGGILLLIVVANKWSQLGGA